jgi:hypothetical protein
MPAAAFSLFLPFDANDNARKRRVATTEIGDTHEPNNLFFGFLWKMSTHSLKHKESIIDIYEIGLYNQVYQCRPTIVVFQEKWQPFFVNP